MWELFRLVQLLLMELSSPGRFFAVCQMKAIIAYTFFHYKVSVANQRQPALKWLFVMSAPDKTLQFRFEPRQRDVL